MSILRRSAVRQGLQDLQRITVQRSLEDAEEIKRERRRQERANSSTATPQDSCSPGLCEGNFLVEQEFIEVSVVNEDPQESEREEQTLNHLVEQEFLEGSVLNEDPQESEREVQPLTHLVEQEFLEGSVLNEDPQESEREVQPLTHHGTEDVEGLTEEYMCSISERTESLNRSVKRSNSFQKAKTSMFISKIDNRLEQYNQAVEVSAQDVKDSKTVPTDFPATPEKVSTRKNLFEAGDAWNQNSGKVVSSKDTEGLKVGVTDLINHWVKANPDDNSKIPSSKSTSIEVKAGDVQHKKNLWEPVKTSSAEKPGGKASMGKRHKFVETGHGKYEKVLIDES